MPPARRAVQQVLGALAGESESEVIVVAPVTGDAGGDGGGACVVVARRDTWSRAARRKKAHQSRDPDPGPHIAAEAETGISAGSGNEVGEKGRAALVAHVWVEEECAGKSEVQLVVQWKRGHDAQVFESFASHVSRKTREALVSGSAS